MATINKPKRKQVTCRCGAYAWPHRLDSGACRVLYNSEVVASLTINGSSAWYESGHNAKDFQ